MQSTHFAPNSFQAKVLDAQQMPRAYRLVLLSKQNSQLSRQAWLHPQLAGHCSQPNRSPSLLAATAKPSANTDAVRAEFSKAGIPDEVITKALKYKPYLGWDPATKLRPALQLWLKQLGSQQLSARLSKYPRLLVRTPEECNDVYLWLASVGIDAERIEQKAPGVMARKLNEVQSTVRAVQEGLLLPDDQLSNFFKRHFFSLQFLPDRVAHTFRMVAELLAVPLASKEMQEVIRVCGQQLFHKDPVVIHQRISFFCQEFKGGQHAAKAALKHGVYQISAGVMRERAAELKAMLGWTEGECNHALSINPRILSYQPSTVASNMQKLQAHNFTSAQVLKIYATTPALAGYDWTSPLNVEKLMYLMLFLQLTPAEIASKSKMLTVSFERCIGPRCEFIYRSRVITPDTPLALSGCSSYIEKISDAKFSATFSFPSTSPPLIYDEEFKQHWWQRWKFLRHDMGLSIADISACRALVCASLPNTLAPRWHFLTQLEAAQVDFKAADHLTALATLSDQLFAKTFDMGLKYDKKLHAACLQHKSLS